MKLLVDIGNTRTKTVLVQNGKLSVVDYSLSLFDKYPIRQLTYASVRHDQLAQDMLQQAQEKQVSITRVKTSAEAFGIRCGYEKFETLGIDRWLAVIGAVAEYPSKDLIVVDAGTATTVDFVTADKRHLGGWIIPGLHLMAASVTQQTDKVFDDDGTDFAYDFGHSTPAALKNGCLSAQIGIVKEAVHLFSKSANLIVAGGTAPLLLEPLAELHPLHEPLIVFKGLNQF